MSRKPTEQQNVKVRALLQGDPAAGPLRARIDDILSGVLELKAEGDTATRSLSRKTLLAILRGSDVISSKEICAVIAPRLSDRSARGYAQKARIVSNALAPIIAEFKSADGDECDLRRERAEIDAEFLTAAQEAEAAGFVWKPTRISAT